jgi:hypothetical protein
MRKQMLTHHTATRSDHRRTAAAIAGAVVALAVGFCGGVAGATPTVTSLLIRSGEMPGFGVRGAPETATGASAWVTRVDAEKGAKARKDILALRAAGFVAGAYENLGPKNGATNKAGGSTVLLFKTAADAAKNVAKQYAQGVALQPKAATLHPLAVGLRGGRGFTAPGSGPHAAAASNAYFSSGRCLFVVGDFINGTHPNTAGPVLAAAKNVARRTATACR